MLNTRVVAAAALLGLSAACSSTQMAAVVTPMVVPAETLAKIQSACQVAQPLVPLAGLVPSKTAQDIASFIGAYCGQMLAGTVPATTDANTLNWLLQNVGSLRALLGR